MIEIFEYNICDDYNELIFTRQCIALEDNIPDLINIDFIEDVDGSKIQIYTLNGKKIKLYNDNTIGAVYIKSETDLSQYFN